MGNLYHPCLDVETRQCLSVKTTKKGKSVNFCPFYLTSFELNSYAVSFD